MRPVLLRVRNVRAIENLEIHLRRFSMLVGANNGGKSAVLDAIRLFYGELTWERRRDRPWTALPPFESWVEVEYELADDEAEELRDHADGGVLRVRRYFASDEGHRVDVYYAIRRYEDPIAWLEPAIGSCVYVPARARLEDYTDLDRPSPLRDILAASASGERVERALDELATSLENLREALVAPDSPAESMSAGLERILRPWLLQPKITFAEPTPDTVLRSHIELRLSSGEQEIPIESQGLGVQRAIIIGLIQVAAEVRGRTGHAKTADFRWVLFEEPELYLHPAQISRLAGDIRELASGPNTAVTIATHDPTMFGAAVEGIESIVRLRREGNTIAAASLRPSDVDAALRRVDERSRYAQASQSCFRRVSPSRSGSLLRARLLTELDGQRAAAFFADHVIVVEGYSDAAFFDWLRSRRLLDDIGPNVGLLDAFGKFELHRAVTALSLFSIPHVIIWDGDAHGRNGRSLVEARCRDEAAWQALRAAANDRGACTWGGIRLAGSIEEWLGINVEKARTWKAGNVLMALDNDFDLPGSPVRQRVESLAAAIADLFHGKDMSAHAAAPMFAGCLFAPPFPVPSVNFAAELQRLPLPSCRC